MRGDPAKGVVGVGRLTLLLTPRLGETPSHPPHHRGRDGGGGISSDSQRATLLVGRRSGGGRGFRLGQRELHDQSPLQRAEIVIRHQREDDLAGGAAMHADCFHVVDIEIVGRLEQHLALNDGAGLELGGGDAADAHLDAFAVAEAPLEENHDAAIRQGGRRREI